MHRIYSSVINKLSLTDVCTIKGLCCRNFKMQFTTLSCPVSLASSIRQSNAMYVPVLPIPALSERKAWIFNRFQSINIIFYRRIQEIIYVSLRWFLNQHRTCCICFSYDNFLYEGRYYYVVFFYIYLQCTVIGLVSSSLPCVKLYNCKNALTLLGPLFCNHPVNW